MKPTTIKLPENSQVFNPPGHAEERALASEAAASPVCISYCSKASPL